MKKITDILGKQNLKKLIRVCAVMLAVFFIPAISNVYAQEKAPLTADSKDLIDRAAALNKSSEFGYYVKDVKNSALNNLNELNPLYSAYEVFNSVTDSKYYKAADAYVTTGIKKAVAPLPVDASDAAAHAYRSAYFDEKVDELYNSRENELLYDILIKQYKAAHPDNEEQITVIQQKMKDQVRNILDSYMKDNSTESVDSAFVEAQKKLRENLAALVNKYETSLKEGKSDEEALKGATLEEFQKLGSLQLCPTIDQLRMKYQSGCWSCLVVERLVSAFLTAASKAYGLAQKAGLTVLFIGTIMWVLMWGLKNVSSLAQVDPSNILSDLFKMLFRIMLAYFFIMAGLKVVSTYFINPIMGTGAVIAQQFWDTTSINGGTSLHDAVEDYVWDDIDEAEADKAEAEAKAALEKTPIPETKEKTTSTPIEYTEEQLKLLDAAKKEAEDFGETDIPNFMIPGTNTGHLTSPVGCRIPPVVKCGKGRKPNADGNCYGSNSHMGLDIGTSGKEGGVVFAMAPGQVVYFNSSSTGNAATITTKDKNGNTWKHRYLHMQDRTLTTFKSLNGTQVAQGQQIGFIGNTGGSSSSHLHIDIKLTGKMGKTTYNSVYVDPLSLSQGKIAPRRYSYNEKTKTFSDNANGCKKGQVDQFPEGFKDRDNVPASGWPAAGKAIIDLSSTYITGNQNGGSSGDLSTDYSTYIMEIPDIKYTGPVDIMSKAVMNSILGATKVITNTTAENMVLGNALTCYSTLDKGGAWHIGSNWGIFRINVGYITNGIMWLQGALIWCTGFLLTLAVAYYLLDICFKIGFAVIALPIVVGLWPFKMTQGKFSTCISIIFKASATFAFLAITTSYSMRMISQALAGPQGGDGLNAIYEAMNVAFLGGGAKNDANVQYVSDRMALLSINFVILIFAFLYSYKLIGATIPQYVDKFFPDKAFGGAQPMHHWSTAATKWAKDTAMKPAGLARDIALHQTGRLAKGAVTGAVGLVGRAMSGKKKDGEDKDDKKKEE